MDALHKTALVIAAIGAINWGLFAFGYDLVNLILGSVDILAKIVYIVIGLSGILVLVKAFK